MTGRGGAGPRRRPPGMMTSTVLGLTGVFGLGAYLAATHDLGMLWKPESAVVVGGGIAVAALLAFRTGELAAALRSLVAIFREEQGIDGDIAALTDFARVHHRGLIREAEASLTRVASPFLRLGLQLVVDGAPITDILHVMNWRIQKLMEQEAVPVRLFRALAGLAPAFGMLGTIMTLVGLMAELGTATVDTVGREMSVALVTTVYGLLLANLFFKPIAIKLEQRTARRVAHLNVLLEGILLVRLGRSPMVVSDALAEFVRERRDELRGAA